VGSDRICDQGNHHGVKIAPKNSTDAEMKIGTHRLKDPGKKKIILKFEVHKYGRGRSRKVEQSLDKLFGKR
jgi:hypothetical protein